ncbi:ABC transporter ATP-binding protein [Paenibacillus sp. y28]|uniref:ABC transporter ATP-binding protein n=1 Tax=Paenibacillus sp. y28 TaxID=3129110 RepID=UPI003019893C
MLEVQQVSKLYENSRGVRGIDFFMNRGEIVGFLGPNGAGKTTTMRMITGYLNPTQGTIKVDGISMADNPHKARRKIGYLPETPPLYPELSVLAYLRFVADLRDVPARQQKGRIEEVIAKLGLGGRERQIIRSLSKGYKQRLGLAQAIIHKPDLLILDEPTSGLDPKQIIEIRQLIRELGEAHTVLLSTHILPEVNAICNRVLIINQGQIVLDDRPDHIAQSMSETFEVSLEVKGARRAVIQALTSLPEVAEVQELEEVQPEPLVNGELSLASTSTSILNSSLSAGEEQQGISVSDSKDPELSLQEEHTPQPDTAATTGSVRLRVMGKDRTDVREAIFFALAAKGLPILEMKRESLSLEEVFLKLTTDETITGAEAGESADALPEKQQDAQASERQEVNDRA